jgi:tRNA G18 (ribose-2'-O)-methylase SpoU
MVRRACTGLVRIEMGAAAASSSSSAATAADGGGGADVDSLNVSVATGILLHHLIYYSGSGE